MQLELCGQSDVAWAFKLYLLFKKNELLALIGNRAEQLECEPSYTKSSRACAHPVEFPLPNIFLSGHDSDLEKHHEIHCRLIQLSSPVTDISWL